ncbi:MAG: hypothetical protein JSV33_05425 [bacterium]|nr:MAG: hypothetical protein JSV33_05425 [bacterium]
MKRRPHHRKKNQRHDSDSGRRRRNNSADLDRRTKKYGAVKTYIDEQMEGLEEEER